jgi:multimeric flavodoxin WrbA
MMIVGACGSPRKAATEHVLKEPLNIIEKPKEIRPDLPKAP